MTASAPICAEAVKPTWGREILHSSLTPNQNALVTSGHMPTWADLLSLSNSKS